MRGGPQVTTARFLAHFRLASLIVAPISGRPCCTARDAVEAIFSALAIRDNIAPPTLNLDNPDVDTVIDLVPHTARKREINVALSNSFGFGGTNASLVLKRYEA